MKQTSSIFTRLHHWIWCRSFEQYPILARPIVWGIRCLVALGRDILAGEIGLRAMSLVYTSLLSLVPMLAFSFSLLKGFGVHNQAEPLLLNLLAPLGEEGVKVAEQILQFVSNIEVKVLGAVGLGVLLYTVTSLIHKIVRAIDFTWNGQGERSFIQRLGIYMLMILLGPLILFSVAGAVSNAVEIPAIQRILSVHVIGTAYQLLLQWIPLMLVTVMLSLVYWILPGKRVHWYFALAGGVLAALLWKLLGWIFAVVVVGSAKYTAIYSAFASALLFMIWLQLSWLVMLLGSRFVFYLQHPESMTPFRRAITGLEPRYILEVLYQLTASFYTRSGGVTGRSIARMTGLPEEDVHKLVKPLTDNGIVLESGSSPAIYLPARSPEKIPMAEVIAAIHGWRDGTGDVAEHEAVSRLLEQLDVAIGERFAGKTLAQWVGQSEK
jgi:membrane protein